MAPARTNSRRAQRSQATRKQQPHPQEVQPQPQPPPPPPAQQQPPPPSPPAANDDEKLFLDPMSGQPLQLYIEKDVDDRDALIEQVIKHGGVVSPGYSGVMYILVDPLKESGQNLYRQYAGKKNKIILNAHWVLHCVRDKTLHGFATQWAGCKVTGKEQENATSAPPPPPPVPTQPANQPAGPFTSTPLTNRNYPYAMYPPGVYVHAPAQAPGIQPVHPGGLPAVLPPPPHTTSVHPPNVQPPQPTASTSSSGQSQAQVAPPPQTVNGHPMPITASSVDPLNPISQQQAQQSRQETQPQAQQVPPPQQPPQPAYQSYPAHTPMPPEGSAPPPGWQPNGIPPPPPHLAHGQPPPPGYRYEYPPREWAYPPPSGAGTPHQPPPHGAMVPHPHPEYEYQYPREHEHPQWVPGPPAEYYAQYNAQYYPHPQEHPMPEGGPSNPPEPSREVTPARGRKRHRSQPQPAPPASTLVVNRRNPPARSPTPPSRVIKSTYGGNLFTSEDVLYLKKYIDYCQEQGLVLSLREICERIAVKAPHHTFYSWRRYCNKHQIRLGGYAMEVDTDDNDDTPVAEGQQTPQQQPEPQPIQQEVVQEGGPPIAEIPHQPAPPVPGVHPGSIAAAKQRAAADIERTRSPTPPRALYRSTTGKGVAFTDEDVIFLVRFLEYRTRQHDGKVDMVTFWKDVASKAPHHSRASWMKFYRRHKHELEHKEGDDPLPPPPPKKMRYTKADDVLLARFFVNRPEGTTDKVFQEFGRMHPHHPWKGWQEHHRIHKAKIDHLISKLSNGEEIEEPEEAE